MIKLFKRKISAICKTDMQDIRTDLLKRWTPGVLSTLIITLLLILLATVPEVWAISGQELEKPKPVFTRAGDEISAKFIPRAKSTSVMVNFRVSKGGKLLDVKGMDFEKAVRPEVDIKNFKSALFVIEIGEVSPAGSEATVNISSDFFSSGTEYRIFNEKLPQPWFNSECQNISMSDRIRDMVITVKDGGPYDSDGEANGSITLIGGPRDSFWGYALGTLFIRFFGIFLVLSLLMIGMIFSGMIFSRLESRKQERESLSVTPDSTPEPESEDMEALQPEEADMESAQYTEEELPAVDYETAAAIAIALHLHFESSDSSELPDSQVVSRRAYSRAGQTPASEQSSWSNHGREQIMRDRSMVYNRGNS